MARICAILIDGTIGVGKTTLARGLSERLDGTFLDGDDFKAKGKPWFCSSLSTCRQLRDAGLQALAAKPLLFIARPMRCLDWVYFRCHFQRHGISLLSVGLQASFDAITDPARGRLFSTGELTRMQEMIVQGYGARPYSDLHLRTDTGSIDATVARAAATLRRLIPA